MTIDTHAVKTVLLAVAAAVAFVAAVIVGMTGSKPSDPRQSLSCEAPAPISASPRRASANC